MTMRLGWRSDGRLGFLTRRGRLNPIQRQLERFLREPSRCETPQASKAFAAYGAQA